MAPTHLAVTILTAMVLLLGATVVPASGTSSASEFSIGQVVVVATDYLNSRASPSLQAPIIHVLEQGNVMKITGGPVAAHGYTWFEVESWMAGPVGEWVAGEYLVSADVPPDEGGTAVFPPMSVVRVDTDLLTVRSGPGLTFSVYRYLPQETVFVIGSGPIAADGYNWYSVAVHEAMPSGWVAGEFLALVSDDGGTPLFDEGDIVTVDVPWLNGRTGPGLEFPVRQGLPGGTHAVVRGGPDYADGYQWFSLDLGSYGTVWAVGEGLVISDDGWDPGFAPGDTVTVATDALNLRDGIGLGAPVLQVLPEGAGLTVTGSSTRADGFTWYPVETSTSANGWVAGEYLA